MIIGVRLRSFITTFTLHEDPCTTIDTCGIRIYTTCVRTYDMIILYRGTTTVCSSNKTAITAYAAWTT